MPVFNFDFNRSITRLDLNAERSGIFTPGLTNLELREDNLRAFNDLAQRLSPERTTYTADQIAGAVRRVLRAAAKGQESAFIKVRMRRASEIRAALKDAQWQIATALKQDMRELQDYLDDTQGLIPDEVPVVGLLDDAILIDTAMPRLRGELDEYADFCRFRVGEAARLDIAPPTVDIDRAKWQVERKIELRLEQQLRRVRGSGYAKAGEGEARFRIC